MPSTGLAVFGERPEETDRWRHPPRSRPTQPLGESEGERPDSRPLTGANMGGPRGTRTHNLRIKSPQLCQLS